LALGSNGIDATYEALFNCAQNAAPFRLAFEMIRRSQFIKSCVLAVMLLASASAPAQWAYRTTEDKMRATKAKFAEVKSTNKAQLGFPYRGGSTLRLILRKSSDAETTVVFFLDRGQLPCHTDCKIAAKFDDEEVKDWEGTGPALSSSDAVFVDDAADFLTRLKTSKKVVVEVLLYDHGPSQFTFNIRGLKWD
jgi:hypothetical protein